jgi:stress-induced morphogen
MSIENSVRTKLNEAFAPQAFELVNESANHNFSRGPEGHFKVLIVSPVFAGVSRIQRHQKVFGLLADEMKAIHALTIRALTPEEYAKDNTDFTSPACAHRD